jgi:hypothetical protein
MIGDRPQLVFFFGENYKLGYLCAFESQDFPDPLL